MTKMRRKEKEKETNSFLSELHLGESEHGGESSGIRVHFTITSITMNEEEENDNEDEIVNNEHNNE